MTKKLRLLFITRDFSNHIEKSSFYLSEELSNLVKLTLYHYPGNIHRILSTLSEKPDFILLNDYKPDYCPTIRGLRTCTIPVGVLMHDLHYKIMQRKRFLIKENITCIFSIYRDPFLKWYPEFQMQMKWLPFHVPLSTFKDYQLKRTTDWLMMGAMNDTLYPLRSKIFQALSQREGFNYYKHPGYGTLDDGKVMAGEVYAKEISKAKIFLTCGSSLNFPLLKYYEALACKTLLLAPQSKELKDLGFIDGETFVEINEENFLEKAEFYLHHEKKRLEIAKRGYDMVRNKHSTKIRAKQLVGYISDLLS